MSLREAATFSAIPSFVPIGVVWYTKDTQAFYKGTGSSAPNVVPLTSTALMGLLQGTAALPGLTSVQIPLSTLASGDNYVFTAPAGMRAYAQVSLYNPTGGSITFNVRISKDGGVTSWRDGSNVVMNTLTATWCSSSLIMEAGDKLNINCTALGLVSMGMAQEFLSTAQIKQVVFTAFVSGDNVVYTCPAGKHAVIPMSETRGTFSDTNGQAFLSNETGGTVTFHLSVKPSGGASTQVSNAGSVLTNVDAAVTANQFSTTFNPGDSLILNTNSSTAGQAFRCNVYEF